MLCGLSLIIKGSRAKFKVFEGLCLAANVGRGILRTYGFYVRAIAKWLIVSAWFVYYYGGLLSLRDSKFIIQNS